MDKDAELLDKVIIFLIILVGAILVFSQYLFLRISQSYWTYISVALIVALVGLIAWMLIEKPKEAHHERMAHKHAKIQSDMPWTFTEKLSYGIVAFIAVLIVFNHVQISQASALIGLSSGLT